MEQVARTSTSYRVASGRMTKEQVSTMASVLPWSNHGWTVWKGMRRVSHLRSGTRQGMLTHRRCLWRWWSSQANWEPLISRSKKCFSQSLRPQCTVGLCAARGYASLRVGVPNVSCYQWMMTLSLGHDGSESVRVYFGVIAHKKHINTYI